MKYVYLSHILTEFTPAYGGKGSLKIKKDKLITGRSKANVYNISMKNHLGTHIDSPNHFFDKGMKICDYQPEAWFFKSPKVIKLKLRPQEILECGDWIKKLSSETDILLFSSGWTGKRKDKEYIFENPGIHPEVGLFLRKSCPNLRAIGIDWISISSYANRDLGKRAHKVFLDPKGVNCPILIIEDMNLSWDLSALKEVAIFPLLIEKIDSSQCTAIGRLG